MTLLRRERDSNRRSSRAKARELNSPPEEAGFRTAGPPVERKGISGTTPSRSLVLLLAEKSSDANAKGTESLHRACSTGESGP